MVSTVREIKVLVAEEGWVDLPFVLQVKLNHGYLGHPDITLRLTEQQWAELYEQGMKPLMEMRAERNTR